jgi:hypothetical protein
MQTEIFKGDTFSAPLDQERLERQTDRVRQHLLRLSDGCQTADWRQLPFCTLKEICEATKEVMHTAISTRVRELAYPWKGGYMVLRRRRGAGKKGLWEYSVVRPSHPAALACGWDAGVQRMHTLATNTSKALSATLKNLDEMLKIEMSAQERMLVAAKRSAVAHALSLGMPATRSLLPTDHAGEDSTDPEFLDGVPETNEDRGPDIHDFLGEF